NTIKTLLKTQDLVVDERLGLIMMRDTPEAIRLAEKLIGLQDQSDPEVMLEVEILEIKRSTLTELGIRLPEQATLAPLVSEGQLLTVEQLLEIDKSTTQVTVGNVVLNARKEDQDGNILANPRIRVRNRDAATVLIGDRVPVITTTSTSTGFVSESVTYVDVGLKLEVEPNIYLDGEVAIKIKLEVSNLVREVISKSGTLAYQIGTRSANTVLRLKDGETQILAGLISDEERATGNKVPLLGDLPMLGRLFGSRKNDHQRSEIVLSITPRLIRSLQRPDLVAAEFESGTQTSLGASSLNFGSSEGGQAEQGQEQPTAPNGVNAAAAQPTAPDQPSPAQAEAPQPESTVPGNNTADAVTPPLAPVVAPTAAPAPAPRIDQPVQKTAASGNVRLQWRGPKQVRAGEQFDVSLQLSSEINLRSLPVMLGFDPQHLQVVRVQEGDYLKQAGASTSFNQRIDSAQGRIFIAAVRQSTPGADSGTNGAGSVVSVTFKAIAAGKTSVKALSITPEPPHDISGALPAAHIIEIVQ
ncbi:MAG TPA: cohesin domain-containing protein, partial [Steroidobacter sp.]|nr:cohesin domain-containing protein [Steroidobacter sp.]